MELSTKESQSVVRRGFPELAASETPSLKDRPAEARSIRSSLEEAATGTWPTILSLVAGDCIGGGLVLAVLCGASAWGLGEISRIGTGFGVAFPALLGLLALSGSYRARFRHPAKEMKQLFGVVGLMGSAAVLTTVLLTARLEVRAAVVASALLAGLVLPVSRVCTRVLCSRFSWWGVPTVVVNCGGGIEDLVDTLDRWPELGLRTVAVLDEAGLQKDTGHFQGKPALAPYLAKAFDIPTLIVSLPEAASGERAKDLAHYTKFFDRVLRVNGNGKRVLWTTGHPETGLRGDGVCQAASTVGMQGLKRAIDLVFAMAILVALAPLFLTIALLIRIDSEGPIFYRQERLGKRGCTFTLLKFRSMYTDAERRLENVLASDPERRREYEKYHKLRDDPRVTPIGEILRQYSLDELPQLINVLTGEMSLVGPRAYMPSELSDMKGLEEVILQTPPGVTGLWQVSGRNQLTFEARIDLDVHYVQNWSLWLDLYLLVRTVPTVVMKEGAA
jgi:Undecaprenyl-phosphate galactose phosphotransferase WbaP